MNIDNTDSFLRKFVHYITVHDMRIEQIQEIVSNQPDTILRRIGEKIINR